MHFAPAAGKSWIRVLLTLGAGACCVAGGAAAEKKGSKAARDATQEHQREELGVNQFTTPSIETLLTALRELRPVPYDRVSRNVPAENPPDRARLALSTGGLIADGFLAVAAEKQSRIEPIGRALLRHAKGLGVGDYVTRHSQGILERASEKNWDAVRAELVAAQRDVEKGMMALKDEEIAHLVALGGWWRGLEIASAIVADGYTPERAALLVQPSMLDYFSDRVSTLNPNFKKTKLWVALNTNLREVRALAINDARTPPGSEAVKKLHTVAKAMNDALAVPEE
jgi:hypothetical protein